MAYGAAIRQGLRIAGRIDSKYNINKIFIDKYAPPAYRPGLRKFVDIAGTAAGGYGIYNFLSNLAEDSPGNAVQTPFKKYVTSRKSYQTRSGSTKRYSRRYCKQPRRNSSNRYSRSR